MLGLNDKLLLRIQEVLHLGVSGHSTTSDSIAAAAEDLCSFQSIIETEETKE